MQTNIKVIGAGFGRTGTMSVKHALEILDTGPCYHMIELTNMPERLPHWEVAAKGKKPDWDKLLEGYTGIMDFPGCLYYKQLMEAYPDAKVILTLRNSEDWYKSARATIFKSYPNRKQLSTILKRYFSSKRIRQLMRLGWLIQKTIYKQTFGYQMFNKTEAIKRYEAHNKEVIETVPKDKLLIYQVQDGWEPLCAFLGKPIPNIPFPKTNKPDHFHLMKNVALSGLVPEEMKKG